MEENQAYFHFSAIQYETDSSLSCQSLQQDPKAIHIDQLSKQHHQQEASEHTHEPQIKWMSSKMRLMKKMMGDDHRMVSKKQGKRAQQGHAQPNNDCSSSGSNSNGNSLPNGVIRVCSNCSTTKTPLWRSGPQGPKSLCNACGIRQMKARRAMRAAAAAATGGLAPATAPKKVPKEERSEVDRTVPFKKRFTIAATSSAQKKIRLEDITISLSKKFAFHQTFPQEEKDAAILLMTLSCGLIHG